VLLPLSLIGSTWFCFGCHLSVCLLAGQLKMLHMWIFMKFGKYIGNESEKSTLNLGGYPDVLDIMDVVSFPVGQQQQYRM